MENVSATVAYAVISLFPYEDKEVMFNINLHLNAFKCFYMFTCFFDYAYCDYKLDHIIEIK